MVSRSRSWSSVSITSLSRTGFTVPSTWVTFSSSKQRSTWIMASVSRIFAKNLLPNPSPLLAPFTSPAMSTISTVVGTMRSGCTSSANLLRRSSGTVITPTFGSIVQKGKLADCAFAFDKQLKRVDLPTFGSPTMPHCNAIYLRVFLFQFKTAKLQLHRRKSKLNRPKAAKAAETPKSDETTDVYPISRFRVHI